MWQSRLPASRASASGFLSLIEAWKWWMPWMPIKSPLHERSRYLSYDLSITFCLLILLFEVKFHEIFKPGFTRPWRPCQEISPAAHFASDPQGGPRLSAALLRISTHLVQSGCPWSWNQLIGHNFHGHRDSDGRKTQKSFPYTMIAYDYYGIETGRNKRDRWGSHHFHQIFFKSW